MEDYFAEFLFTFEPLDKRHVIGDSEIDDGVFSVVEILEVLQTSAEVVEEGF